MYMAVSMDSMEKVQYVSNNKSIKLKRSNIMFESIFTSTADNSINISQAAISLGASIVIGVIIAIVSVFTCNSASLELPPTIISKFPAMVRMVFVCASHHSNCLGVNSNSTLTVFPAGICTRLKARSVLDRSFRHLLVFSDIPVLLLPRHDYRHWLQE